MWQEFDITAPLTNRFLDTYEIIIANTKCSGKCRKCRYSLFDFRNFKFVCSIDFVYNEFKKEKDNYDEH